MSFLIVGGGCFGLSTALALCEANYEPSSVIVFDKSDRLPAEDSASFDINKMVRSDYGDDVLYTEMAIRAMERFRNWNQEYSANFPRTDKEPQLFYECGVLMCTLEMTEEGFEGKSICLQNTEEITQLPCEIPALKSLQTAFPEGYINRQGGWCDSAMAMAFLYRKLVQLGVRFQLGPNDGAVVSVFPLNAGPNNTNEKSGIKTANGTEYYGTVIVAAGAWTSKLIPEVRDFMSATAQCVIHMAISDPHLQAKYRNSCCWMADITNTGFYGFPLQPRTGLLKFANHGKGFETPKPCHSRLEDDDQYLSLSQKWHAESLIKFRAFLSQAFPDICELPVDYFRICWYMDTLDGDFLIDFVPVGKAKNIIVASGGSGHGFKFLPIIGRYVVDLLAGKGEKRFGWRRHHTNSGSGNKNSHK